ncbi:MAG: DNA mismatch repair endonuclease MutL [Chlamydiia bacterium]|nr:DNA mismatch repair endonuclease MutL [Chlamydiia bacterium]
MPIRVLSDQTINKIAAGEVIENPASVVKELIENAFDANSCTITVEIEKGGFGLIRVSDDGCGMSRDDLALSLERHATSKIQEINDLDEVVTMGFRGEALASIAAISKVKVTSAEGESPLGSVVIAEGGKMKALNPAARNRGTTIEIASLFYNVPARKKFQRSEGASLAEITKLLTKFALAHPGIHLRYFADGKEMFHTLPGELKERCKALLGSSFLKGANLIDFSMEGCSVKGYIGSPMEARSNRLGQYLFVNGRSVICPQISYPIYEGYGTRLPSKLHPTFILHISLPPDWVDVNVHPQKREVRLREEGKIQNAIRKGVMDSFQGKEMVKAYPKGEWNFDVPLRFQEKKEDISSPTFEFQEELKVAALFDHYLLAHPSSYFSLPHSPGPYDGMFLIDLKGVYARILYERVTTRDESPLQTLMIPLTLEFSSQERDVLERSIPEIKKMGIDLRPFGEGVFLVDALSPEIEEEEVKGLLEALLDVFDPSLTEKVKQKKLAFTLSSYARSQKKGWSLVEARQMIKELMKTSSPYDCPQGKPTVIHLGHDTIKSLFQKAHR